MWIVKRDAEDGRNNEKRERPGRLFSAEVGAKRQKSRSEKQSKETEPQIRDKMVQRRGKRDEKAGMAWAELQGMLVVLDALRLQLGR